MQYNKYIDHTLLKPDCSIKQIDKLCAEAIKYKFCTVCVNPCFISRCKKNLKGSSVKICTVIGFPLGSNTTAAKAFEAKDAIKKGADEIDMVINISQLKAKNFKYVIDEINAVKVVCKSHVLKVIVETCLLSTQDKINACKCINNSTADFIKTSTGFSTGGATLADIKLFKKYLNKDKLIKAAGGVRTHEDLINFVKAGANRIGTSRGVDLIK